MGRSAGARTVGRMSGSTQDEPVMAGSDDADDATKLAGLKEQVDQDHEGPSAGTAADDLHGRMEESRVEPGEASGLDG